MSRLVKLVRSLDRAKERRAQGLFVVEGVRAVEAVLQAETSIEGVLYHKELLDSERGRTLIGALQNRGVVCQEVAKKEKDLFETESPQGILAVVRRPVLSLSDLKEQGKLSEFLLVLDGVSDPGNMGTLLRTAAAAGLNTVFLAEDCVDPTNPKVVRSAVGELLHLRIIEGLNQELFSFLQTGGYRIAACRKGGTDHRQFDYTGRLALVLGSEAHGLSSFWEGASSESVGIAIAPSVESLNVAAAGAVLLFEARNKRDTKE